ncbi:MAG: S8 family serine peptidase [Acidobacteria bacterium]|nr:S8 family serine peptidase [Acidobacteriota bacterium]
MALLLAVSGPVAVAGSLAPNLRKALADAGPEERLPVVVLMAEMPDAQLLLGQVRGMTRAERRAHVVLTMKGVAERSQGNVRALVTDGELRDRVHDIRVLWGVNGLALEAAPDAIERLAELPEVRWVLYDRAPAHADLELDAGPAPGMPFSGNVPSGPDPDATVAPDVVAHGAKQVWDELGYTGLGVVVAVIDTGLDRTHPDLADHIWSNPDEIPANGVDDDGNGHVDDSWGWDFCADSQPVVGTHGTQVAGQVAGDGTNGTVTGMAPDALLMSLGIDCDTPSRAWQASDYAIAEGADLITQSYSWWWTDRPDYAGFRRQADVELAAGVIHANSAGNFGSSQSTQPIPYNISTPANCPPPWLHPDQTMAGGMSSVLAVGDVNWSTGVIASSSSLGPSTWEDIQANTDPSYPYNNPPEYRDYSYENGAQMGLIKPDLSAYGTGTNSTCPGPYYCQFSGTSSATPHVAGAIALMLQSNSEATPEELARALMTTAQHRGDPGKNNVYGAGLLQAYPAVLAVESGVIYRGHAFDDTAFGNGDAQPDPGEQLVLSLTVESRNDEAIDGLHVIVSTTTPGITIHDQVAYFPSLPARGTVVSLAPHISLSVDPGACTALAVFDLEFRYGGTVRRSSFRTLVGTERPLTGLDFDMETAAGWSSNPGSSTRGSWVREDPVGVSISGGLSNPEDDTTPDPGVRCWVTGSGGGGPNDNDVDGGSTFLFSPIFGAPNIYELSLAYDRWYYDDSSSSDSFKAEVTNDGGASWVLIEQRVSPTGGWKNFATDLMTLLAPSGTMRLRFTATDGGSDNVLEAAVDEVHVSGMWVDCQDFSPPLLPPPNPVGDTLRLAATVDGHVLLTWDAPPVDAAHGAATLYRIERAAGPQGPWNEAGTASSTRWFDVDALGTPDASFYRVTAENSGGAE